MTEEELTRILNTQLATFFGQMSKRVDTRINKLELIMKADFEKIQTSLEGLMKRIDTDDQERAAMNQQLARHQNWIGQIADKTSTKLVPER